MKVFFETYGCSLNLADTETMKGLVAIHYLITENVDDADVIVMNSCTVKGPTENKIIKRFHELKKRGKKIVVTGCIPQADLKNEFKDLLKDVFVVGTNQLSKIMEVLDKIQHDQKVEHYLSTENEIRLNLPKIRSNQYIEIIPISKGCMNTCYYCKTKYARGNLVSFPIDEIVNEAKRAIKEGVKEIWLTSQDNGCYGYDINTNLVDLLNKILLLDGKFMIRIGMANPQYVKDYFPDLIEVLKHPNVFKFIHLPVQSGSDNVLKLMNRGHTVQDYVNCVEQIRKEIPDITISTDIICGYPGESDEDHKKTVALLRTTKPSVINLSRFWARSGTVAATKKQVSGKIIKARTGELTLLKKKISTENNKNWIGWKGNINISEKGKDNSWVGRNFAYKPVVVFSKEDLMGKTLHVEIKGSTIWDLRGSL